MKKSFIIVKSNDNKCFLWCHIRHLNPLIVYPARIRKADRIMVKKIVARLSRKITFVLMYFAMKRIWFILSM